MRINTDCVAVYSGLDRITFVTATIIYSSSPPYFWLPDFGNHVTSRNQGFSRSKGENPGYEAVELDLNVGNDEYISLSNFGDRGMNGFEVTEGSFQSLPSRPVIEIIIKKSPV